MDPLSFTASLIGVANFAGTVVTKLYTYCKAVKDCEEDVIKLRLELDIFTAVIDRLAQVIGDEDENENVDKGEDNEAQIDKEAKEVFDWLCPVNPRIKHQEFRKEYQPGTCLWIFDRPEYRKWSDMPNSALWIHAIPGAGKTVLA